MKIEEEIRALELLRDKLKVLPIPHIEYLFEYGRLFEGILTKQDEEIFLKNLNKKSILKLDAIYADNSAKSNLLIGRKIKINADKFNDYLREIDKKYLGEIGEFNQDQDPKKSILKKDILKKLTIEIGNLDYFKNKDDFYDFLINCKVDKRFFYEPLSSIFHTIYPCSIYSASNIYNAISNPAPKPKLLKNEEVPEYRKGKCGQLFRILAYYSYSKNKNVLFDILESSTSLIIFDLDKNNANKFEGKLNDLLELGGYCLENGTIEELKNDTANIKTTEENQKGFIKINEQKISIGSTNTAKYQLLKSLCSPEIGLAKTIDTTFEEVKKYMKKKTSDSDDEYTGKTYKTNKIKGVVKELQRIFARFKINKKFKFNIKNDKIWLVYKP